MLKIFTADIESSEEDHERVPKAMILGHKDRDDPQAPLQ